MNGEPLTIAERPPRIPAKARFVVGLLAAALVVLVVYGEIVFSGRTFTTGLSVSGLNGVYAPPGNAPAVVPDLIRVDRGASAWQFEPWAHVVREQIVGGHLPLWNPYQAMGAPLLANMQSAPLDLLLLPVRISPTPLGWDIAYLLAFALGGAAMFLYLRSLGLRNLAGVAGAAAFVLSGWFVLYSNEEFLRSYMYLPAVLLLIDLVMARGTPVRVGGMGLVITGNLFTGFPEASVMVLGFGGAYAVMRAWTLRRPLGLVQVTAGFALGGALAAPQILLFLQYLGLGFTSHMATNQRGLGFDQDATGSLSWLLPFLRGVPFADYVTGGYTGVRDWTGCAVAALGLVALATTQRRRRDPTWFMAAAAALLILKQYGFPGVQWVGRLPGLSAVDFPSFAPPVASFALAALAAVGIDALARGRVSWRWFAVLAAGAAATLAVLVALNHPRRLLEAAPHLHTEAVFLIGGLAALAVCAAVVFQSRRVAPWVAALAIVAELGLVAPRGFYQQRFDTLQSPSWANALPTAATDRVYGLDGQVYPDTAGAVQREDIRALDAIYVERYFRYIKEFIQPTAESRFIGGPIYTADEVTGGHTAGNPMFDLLGVRYVFADASRPDDQALPRMLSPSSAPVRSGVVAVGGDRRLALLEHGGEHAAFPVVEPTPASFTFSFTVAGAAPAPVTLEVDALTGQRTVGLWRQSYTGTASEASRSWQQIAVQLPPQVSSVVLRVDPGPGAGATVAWADVRVGTDQYRRVGTFGPTAVYENANRLPRAFVVHSVHAVSDETAADRFFASHSTRLPDGGLHVVDFDPRREAVVETPHAEPLRADCPGREDARIIQYDAERIAIDTTSPCPGLLVLTDTDFPGWTATVNGRSAPILPTDIALRGVAIPAGDARVVFSYEPSSLASGILIAILAAFCFGSGSVVWIRRRRSGAGRSDLTP